MTPVTLTFKHERETKNTQRFQEEVTGDAKPIVGTLYLNKEVAGDSKTLTVTIAPAA